MRCTAGAIAGREHKKVSDCEFQNVVRTKPFTMQTAEIANQYLGTIGIIIPADHFVICFAEFRRFQLPTVRIQGKMIAIHCCQLKR